MAWFNVEVTEDAMRITSIKQQVKNPERASIFIDGKYAFSLSLDELVAEKLKIGMELDAAEQKRLKKLSDDGKLRARALEWVMSRPRSQREFRDYMFRKKAEPEMTDRLTNEFVEKGYLDDRKFTLWLVDMRRRGGKSERAIVAELFRKGVTRDITREVLAEDVGEMERLKAIMAKKRKLSRYEAGPQKLMAYLLRQGFSYDDIKRVMSNPD